MSRAFAHQQIPPAGPWNGYAVRRHLAETLSKYADDPTVSVLISSPTTKRGTFIPATHKTMLHSTFCLQPPGDTATRKGYFEVGSSFLIHPIFRCGSVIDRRTDIQRLHSRSSSAAFP